MTKKNVLVTTSIAYVNGTPHVGFAMESIQADVFARWNRKKGHDVFFLTGTDEHGSKVYREAEKKGMSAQELTDHHSAAFRKLMEVLHVSNDDFIRTTEERHKIGAKKLWEKIEENGDVVNREFEGLYCVGCETFLTEKELNEDGNCPNHLRPPEKVTEENIFFLLSKYSDVVKTKLETGELEIAPDFRKGEILSLAKEGLKDVSFSRPKETLPWGVAVPGNDKQVMYVWCDALSNYYTALGFGSNDNWKKYWEDGEVTHFIGKDILRFHAGIWPGMLLSANLPLPKRIAVHGFLTSEGHKMSKSLGNVVDPFETVENFGGNPDPLRYFLLAEVPFGRDADFSQKRFLEIYNAHLANGLGNSLTRVLVLAKKAGGVEIPTEISDEKLRDVAENIEKNVDAAMEKMELHNAVGAVFTLVEELNMYIDKTKPWMDMKEDMNDAKESIGNCLAALRVIGNELVPFLPNTSAKVLKALEKGETEMLFPRKDIEK